MTVSPTIAFIIPAVPVPQPRQRHRIVETKGGNRFVHNYTPTRDPVNAFKASVQQAASGMFSGSPLEGPLRLSVVFVMPRPKSKIWKRKPMPREWYEGRADRENLEKSLKDALNRLVWRDDKQVVSGPVDVVIAAGDERPHVEVLIESLEGVEPPARTQRVHEEIPF